MKKAALFLLILTTITACNKQEKKLKEQIIGTWAETTDEYGFSPPVGISFFQDGRAKFHHGIMIYKYDSLINQKKMFYYGTKATYRIEDDSLTTIIFNNTYPITTKIQIKDDSLTLFYKTGNKRKLARKILPDKSRIGFDRIIVKNWSMRLGHSGISLNKDGSVLYFQEDKDYKNNFFSGKINIKRTEELFNNFTKVKFNDLDTLYYNHLDGQFVELFFFKNNKIIKKVLDGNYASPAEFIWSYIPLKHLHEEIELIEEKGKIFPELLPESIEIDTTNFFLLKNSQENTSF